MNYRVEWSLIVLPWAGLVLLLIPPVAMLALVVAAVAVAGLAVALAGATLAAPYLLARSLHRHWRARRASPAMRRPGHAHAKIVGHDMGTPDVQLSTHYASHPFAAPSGPRAAADQPAVGA